jgi:hypothetical protein
MTKKWKKIFLLSIQIALWLACKVRVKIYRLRISKFKKIKSFKNKYKRHTIVLFLGMLYVNDKGIDYFYNRIK